MSVTHVIDIAQKLEFIVHGGNDGVQAVSDEGNLLVVLGIVGQRIDSNVGELGEVLLSTGSLLEESVNPQLNS